jgi:hypothetical protein
MVSAPKKAKNYRQPQSKINQFHLSVSTDDVSTAAAEKRPVLPGDVSLLSSWLSCAHGIR